MTASADSSQDIAGRLNQLEREHQRLRRVAVIGLCLLPVGLGAFAANTSSPVVQAERVELVSAGGKRQAVLKADSAGIDLLLFDPKGRVASAMHLGAEGMLKVIDSSGSVAGSLGGPPVRHLHGWANRP